MLVLSALLHVRRTFLSAVEWSRKSLSPITTFNDYASLVPTCYWLAAAAAVAAPLSLFPDLISSLWILPTMHKVCLV